MRRQIAVSVAAALAALTAGTAHASDAAASNISCTVQALGGPVSEHENGVVASTNDVDFGGGVAACVLLTGESFTMSSGWEIQQQQPDGSWAATTCNSGGYTGASSIGNTTTGSYAEVVSAPHLCNWGPAGLGHVMHRTHAGVWNNQTLTFIDDYSTPWPMN